VGEVFKYMPLLLEKLNNIRSLRVISREFTIDVLEDMLAKLMTVTEEKRAAEQAAQALRAEHQEK
jgi:DNA-binding protein StpA